MLTLSIVTPERRVIGPVRVQSITLPGGNGEMTILPGHARLLSIVETGVVTFEMEVAANTYKTNHAVISFGYVQVSSDRVTLLAETLELTTEINMDRAEKARQRAEDKLKMQEQADLEDITKWQRKHLRAITRIQAAHLLPKP